MKGSFYGLLIVILVSCKQQIPAIGNTSITVFNDANIYFDMALKSDSISSQDEIIRLDAGRVLLKKVKLPNYRLQPHVSVSLTLASHGDPWDKSGSLFVIPNTSDLSLFDLEQEVYKKLLKQDSFPGIQSKVYNEKHYQPNVELIRFMTPFGVGHFNTDKRVESLKPVYIPKWENEVSWEQDVTHLLPLLEDEIYIGVFIDTWTKEGYTLSATLNFEESKIPNHKKQSPTIIPIVNTTKYSSSQKYYDAFSKGNLTVDLPLEQDLKNVKLYYITTGHGGHEEGDEFTKKENVITLNNNIIKQFIPWRDDCASFRRFNPASGVWTEETEWKGKTIEERIASSDYSRSNWCPGSDVKPEIIPIGNLTRGTHHFEFAIPEAQAIDGDKINYWMVSAYLVAEPNHD